MDLTKKPHTVGHIGADFDIRPDKWEKSGPKDNQLARLLTTVRINGHFFHCEAYQVRKNRDGEQCIADPSFQEEWEGMCALQNHDGGPFTTQRIGRREYVIVISPFLN
jgi:hypothetical protein